jgi:hypothetical protein
MSKSSDVPVVMIEAVYHVGLYPDGRPGATDRVMKGSDCPCRSTPMHGRRSPGSMANC